MQPETLPHKANCIDLDGRHSVGNRYCQTQDVPQAFRRWLVGLPTMSGYPPIVTSAPLSYRTAELILRHKHWFG